MQSRKKSILESVINTVVGFVISLILQILIFKSFDINLLFTENLFITFLFTITSFLRSYIIRRIFVKSDKNQNN